MITRFGFVWFIRRFWCYSITILFWKSNSLKLHDLWNLPKKNSEVMWDYLNFFSCAPNGRNRYYTLSSAFKQLSNDLCMQLYDYFESDIRVECPCKDYHILNVIYTLITHSFPCYYFTYIFGELLPVLAFISERRIFLNIS